MSKREYVNARIRDPQLVNSLINESSGDNAPSISTIVTNRLNESAEAIERQQAIDQQYEQQNELLRKSNSNLVELWIISIGGLPPSMIPRS